MYVAMNRFKVTLGRESDFIEIWKKRETFLDTVPGFKTFNLLQSASSEEYTLFASHSIWETKADFEEWTKSDAFRKAHSGAKPSMDLYLGPPNFEGFESVI